MSGPPYPRGASAGPAGSAGSIGGFAIGESPIGAFPAFDYWNTIISQYANSPILTQLIANFFDHIDQTTDFDSFFDNIWNIDTAQGYGLDVWGRIVGVSRVIQVPSTGAWFGFNEAMGTGGIGTFGEAAFFSGTPLTSNFELTDSAFRVLIFAKALSNISNGSAPAINQLLLNLFPNRGNCYVTDGLNMTMTYTFEFGLSAVELAILEQTGVLPKPVGVSATVVEV